MSNQEPESKPEPVEQPSGEGLSVQRLVRHLDLFSGIGGFALAARMVGGIKTIAFSEIEPYASSILKRHWPDVPNLGDIRNVRGIKCDLITGGFPCQPFSSCGPQRGRYDARHLWPEMLRVIGESRPTWVLGENVAAIDSVALGDVLADLEAEGYQVRAFGIPACAVGAWHIRERRWILAHSASDAGELLAGQWEDLPDIFAGHGKDRRVGDSWRSLPRVCGGSDGIPRRVDRIAALGNAIVPQVAAEIIRCMMRVDRMANETSAGTDASEEKL